MLTTEAPVTNITITNRKDTQKNNKKITNNICNKETLDKWTHTHTKKDKQCFIVSECVQNPTFVQLSQRNGPRIGSMKNKEKYHV